MVLIETGPCFHKMQSAMDIRLQLELFHTNQQKSSPFRSWQNQAPLLVCLFYGVLLPPSLRAGSEEERERKHRARRDREPRRLQMGWECSLIMTKDVEQTPSMELDWTHLLLTCDYLCIYNHMFLGAHLAGQMPRFMRQWPPWGLDVLHTFV
jgi:hypothetical protein